MNIQIIEHLPIEPMPVSVPVPVLVSGHASPTDASPMPVPEPESKPEPEIEPTPEPTPPPSPPPHPRRRYAPPVGTCPSCDQPFTGMTRRCYSCHPARGPRKPKRTREDMLRELDEIVDEPTVAEPTATPGQPMAKVEPDAESEPVPVIVEPVVGPWLARELEAARGVVEAVSGLDRGAVARIFNYVTSALAPPGEPR
jgi:hypothetical protein